MTKKSVSITRNERFLMKKKIQEQYNKLAAAQHPDPMFHENISRKIYMDKVNDLAEITTKEILPYIIYEKNNSFETDITRIQLDGIHFKLLNQDLKDVYSSKLIVENSHLANFKTGSVELPFIFVPAVDKGLMPFPFRQWGEGVYGSKRITVTQEIAEEIKAYNDKMDSVYTDLAEQLKTLIDIIDECKSTKMFEAKLPNLIALYPKSILRKIEKKNELSATEPTEKELRLAKATASLAAASLLKSDS